MVTIVYMCVCWGGGGASEDLRLCLGVLLWHCLRC
jgi:hypothetical protein